MPSKSESPRDPRSRLVREMTDTGRGAVTIRLECGHLIQRRPMCPLSRAICPECRA